MPTHHREQTSTLLPVAEDPRSSDSPHVAENPPATPARHAATSRRSISPNGASSSGLRQFRAAPLPERRYVHERQRETIADNAPLSQKSVSPGRAISSRLLKLSLDAREGPRWSSHFIGRAVQDDSPPFFLHLFARASSLFVLSLLALATGCANPSSNQSVSAPPAPPPIPTAPAPDASKTIVHPNTSLPTGPLSLDQAIALATERNPALQAHAWASESARARIRQARLWPNPELEAERENFAGTGQFSGSENAETTLSLAQALPLGGNLKRRAALATLEADLADWDYHAARLDTVFQTTTRYIAALSAEQRLNLARQELELAQATERIARTRVDAGEASPVELSRVVVPVVTAELALAQAEREHRAARLRLALAWGASQPSFSQLDGDLAAISPPPPPAALSNLVRQSPAVARWATEVSARLAQRRLAQAEAIPDPTVRLGQKHDRASGDDALVLGISLPLPLFDRQQGSLLAARLDERAAASRQRAAELRLEALLSEAYAILASAHEEATALRDRALPAADQAYQATQRAFQEGELAFLDVLDAQRTFFQLQGRYLDALAKYHMAAAEIESLLGRGLTEISNQVTS